MEKILLCLDADPQPSVFDAVVAIDAGAHHLLRHGGVRQEDVRNLVYGAIFTRGVGLLKNTAVFIGGSDVTAGEKLLNEATGCFFGNSRVSVMLDSNGANTTAAAAVLAARRHVPLGGAIVTVLGGTGSVGRRVVHLLASEGAQVRVGSRRLVHAEAACDKVLAAVPTAELSPRVIDDHDSAAAAIDGAVVVVSCGSAGVEMISADVRQGGKSVQVAIDLNAVPPTGIGGTKVQDKATEREGQICYGALGVGGAKMRIHKAAIARLFSANDLVLDVDEIYALAKALEA
ncbi:MAG: methylene-tetrahydromethanopterin dehydrogenase N-terminal domain-containing protein [Planctomycetota bacterium]